MRSTEISTHYNESLFLSLWKENPRNSKLTERSEVPKSARNHRVRNRKKRTWKMIKYKAKMKGKLWQTPWRT
jgi:hypothetical protein